MAKVKINTKFERKVCQVQIGDVTVDVTEQIPYDEKMRFAKEYAAGMCVLDEENELIYSNFDGSALNVYLVCKWYTNINLKKYETNMGALVDDLGEGFKDIMNVCGRDAIASIEAGEACARMTRDTYVAQHSLSQKLKMSLKSILSEGDLIEYLSKSTVMNETMIDVLNLARKDNDAKDKVVPFSWAAKKEK